MTIKTIPLPNDGGTSIEAVVNNHQVTSARVVSATGMRRELGPEAAQNLNDLVRHQELLFDVRGQMRRLQSEMPALLQALAASDPEHPGVKPYTQELQEHRDVAKKLLRALVEDRQAAMRSAWQDSEKSSDSDA